MQKLLFLCACLSFTVASLPVASQSTRVPARDLSVFEAFTDHAVLQRDVAHPIWGWAKPNTKISVALNDELLRTKAGKDGKWTLDLPATPAGGPHTITIADRRETIQLQDVYFGDVYLLSGQSNMEWRLVQSDPDSTRARAIADPLIRQILVKHTNAGAPLDHLELSETWKPGVASEIADFSGVGSYFAHYLRESGVNVPIGLVHSSWGGSRIEPWLSAQAYGVDPDEVKQREEVRSGNGVPPALVHYQQEFGDGEPPTTDEGKERGYFDPATDLAGWGTMELPGHWEARGYEHVDGVFYFRRTFTLTPAQASAAATLKLGAIDDGDQTYINGKMVGGHLDDYSLEREYEVAASTLKAGENTIVIRVNDHGGGGGLTGGPDKLKLITAEGEISLAGDWNYRVGEWEVNVGGENQLPVILYNAMIAPLQNWPLTGVLWYQGESNARPEDAENYADLMRTLVTSWRTRFQRPELPFYWVSLANFMEAPTTADQPGWAVLRASQTAATDLPMTGQAIITDIGEAGDIHPKNKWEVGRRLSLHARKDIYGQDVQASSPVATDLDLNGPTAEIEFAETGTGLTTKTVVGERYGFVRGLTIQDENGDWHWAIGLLNEEENRLMVINPTGTDIRVVRYAWADNPDDANLFSREGLPVTPFELKSE